MTRELAFIPVDLELVRFRASQGDDTDHHVTWDVEFSPEMLDDTDYRVVIATVHAGGEHGWADVTVGAFLRDSGAYDYSGEDVAEVVKASEAVESLYDYARGHLVSMLSLVGATVEIPRKSPSATVSQLEAPDEESDVAEENMIAHEGNA